MAFHYARSLDRLNSILLKALRWNRFWSMLLSHDGCRKLFHTLTEDCSTFYL